MADPDLPEYTGNPFISCLPPPMSTEQAIEALTEFPSYNPAERNYPAHLRLHCVQRLGRYFDPMARHLTLEAHVNALIRQGSHPMVEFPQAARAEQSFRLATQVPNAVLNRCCGSDRAYLFGRADLNCRQRRRLYHA